MRVDRSTEFLLARFGPLTLSLMLSSARTLNRSAWLHGNYAVVASCASGGTSSVVNHPTPLDQTRCSFPTTPAPKSAVILHSDGPCRSACWTSSPSFAITPTVFRTPSGSGLIGALAYYGLDSIGVTEKDEMRELVLRGGPWSDAERAEILDYCETDVAALARLLPAMLPNLDLLRAPLRGRYMVAAARMERNGIPNAASDDPGLSPAAPQPVPCRRTALCRARLPKFEARSDRRVDHLIVRQGCCLLMRLLSLGGLLWNGLQRLGRVNVTMPPEALRRRPSGRQAGPRRRYFRPL